MQTEIKFLLELVLNHKLPADAKKLCLERIGEVESSLLQSPRQAAVVLAPAKSAAQLKFESEQAAGLIQPPAEETVVAPQVSAAAQRIVGGEVLTGNGTRGPRKF